MDKLIQEAIEKNRIWKDDGERIQRNIDAVNFVSPKGKEKAIISCIKHMAKCKRIIEKAIIEDSKERTLNQVGGR